MDGSNRARHSRENQQTAFRAGGSADALQLGGAPVRAAVQFLEKVENPRIEKPLDRAALRAVSTRGARVGCSVRRSCL